MKVIKKYNEFINESVEEPADIIELSEGDSVKENPKHRVHHIDGIGTVISIGNFSANVKFEGDDEEYEYQDGELIKIDKATNEIHSSKDYDEGTIQDYLDKYADFEETQTQTYSLQTIVNAFNDYKTSLNINENYNLKTFKSYVETGNDLYVKIKDTPGIYKVLEVELNSDDIHDGDLKVKDINVEDGEILTIKHDDIDRSITKNDLEAAKKEENLND